MNKRYSIFLILISCVLSIKGMDGGSNELSLIQLHLSDGMSYNIEQWKIPYFDMVHRSHIFCQNHAFSKVVIPNVSHREMRLANNMLNAAQIDLRQQLDLEKLEEENKELKIYFNSLSIEDKNILITAVGEYDNNSKRKLCSPYLTEKLAQIHLHSDIKANIDKYLRDVKDDIRIFFTQNILMRNRNQKSLTVEKPLKDILQNDVHRTQLCIDGTMSYNGFGDPIPLRIGNQSYATYASHFPSNISDDLEFRITSVQPALRAGDLIQPLSSKCSLWIIDREKNIQNVFAIEHKEPIKGCFFSENEDKTEHYVVTYSDNTLCFSTITGVEDGVPVLQNTIVPLVSSIVAITQNYTNNRLNVYMYGKLQTISVTYSMKGSFIKRENLLFQKQGILQQVVCDPTCINAAWTDKNGRAISTDTGLCIDVDREGEVFLYRFETSKNYQDNNDQQKILKRMYSPDGKLLFHILYPRMYEDKKLYVGIHIYDVESGKFLAGNSRPYKDFAGMGFSPDGTNLVEFDLHGWIKKIPTFFPEDQQCVQSFRNKYLFLGNIFLLRQIEQLIEYICQLACGRQTEKLDKNNPVFILLEKMRNDKNGVALMINKVVKNKESDWLQWLKAFAALPKKELK
jgi:hypothetical protein